MYHRIGNERFDPWGLAVEESAFAAQLDWLAKNREVLPLIELARRQKSGTLSRHAVALTFDDAYASVSVAAGMIAARRLHATVFVPAALIERGENFWWDELAHVVMGFAGDRLVLGSETCPVPPPAERDAEWKPHAPPRTERQQLFLRLWRKLHAMSSSDLFAAMKQLSGQVVGAEPLVRDRPLRPDGLRLLNRTAIDFGSHGLTHPALPLLDNDQKRIEIRDSLARCKGLTGHVPASFAYPFGDFDRQSRDLVEDAGYECACAGGDRFIARRSDPFALPRLHVGNWDARRLHDMLGG